MSDLIGQRHHTGRIILAASARHILAHGGANSDYAIWGFDGRNPATTHSGRYIADEQQAFALFARMRAQEEA